MFRLLIGIFLFSIVFGYKVISNVPPLLHTPLMSGMNALSGIIVLGAIVVMAEGAGPAGFGAAAALFLGMINVAGGFWVTERMLRMFRKENVHCDGDS